MDAIDEIFFGTVGKLNGIPPEKFLKEKIEHIKRRPALIAKWSQRYKEAHEHWLRAVKMEPYDPRRHPIRLIPAISPQEQKIINTPTEELLCKTSSNFTTQL